MIKTYILNTKPFDDNKATFDLDEKRYIPTQKFIEGKIGKSLSKTIGSKNDIKVFLDEMSEKAYDIVYDMSNSTNRSKNIAYKEYILATDHTIRNEWLSAIAVYIRAGIDTGIDKIQDEHGYDFDKNTKIDIEKYSDVPTQFLRKIKKIGLTNKRIITFDVGEITKEV